MNFAEGAEPPPNMTEEEIDTHIMGIALINHHNPKKGT